MSLSDLLRELEDAERWFKDQASQHIYAAFESTKRLTGLRHRVDEESSGLVKHGRLEARGLSELSDAAVRGEIPNESWYKLKTLIEGAIKAESAATHRLAEESGYTPIPPEALERAHLAFEITTKSARDSAEAAVNTMRSHAPGTGTQSSVTRRILDIEKELTDELLRARLDTLVEALHFFRLQVASFKGVVEGHLDKVVDIRKAGVMSELERRSRVTGGGWDGAAMAAINTFNRAVDSALRTQKQKLELLIQDDERASHVVRNWRDYRPERMAELVPLASKNAYLEDIDAAISEAGAATPLCLLLVDVDDFKSVNERFKHAGGDQALVAVAEVVASVSKGKGKAYRWGGDEFAVLLPNVDVSEARATSERARAEVERLKFDEVGLCVTVTIGGVVAVNASRLGAAGILDVADTTLFALKGEGKNRIRIEVA